ncbi:MAG: hypothetical protein DI609_00390 [Corynebacterium urealyticum]|uniref:Uncharacterized protein n=1 Tax=Corynebacterium urealyticum TaxID=43771 RepID=A0A2W5BD46_9CORY|nr:MAG: hypothetical protein DI609_00390 [Corynebacterium urealyticum]
MSQTPTSPEFIHALTLALNSAVSVARAQHAVNAEKRGTASPEDSVAARHLGMLLPQFDGLCNDLYLLDATEALSELYDELDDAVSRGDVTATEKIRDRELALHSPEVSRVRDVDEKIRHIESQVANLRAKMEELEEERDLAAVVATWAGTSEAQLAEATDRDVAEVKRWLRGV